MNTTRQRARDRIGDLLNRQARERADLAHILEVEETEAARSLAEAVVPGAGAKLAEAIAEIETQLRQDHRTGDLLAREVHALPSWAVTGDLPTLTPHERAEGRRAVAVYCGPVLATDGRREPVAYALVDVSATIFGDRAVAALAQDRADRAEAFAAEVERNRREAEARARRR